MKENCLSELVLNEITPQTAEFIRSQEVIDIEIPIKGLMLKERAIVSDCSPKGVEAHCSNISHFCTGSLNHPLFIKLNRGDKALSCRLADLLVHTGKLFMKDFRMMENGWIDRQYDRVQPRNPIFVSIVNGSKIIKANLFDLSATGMRILVDRNILNNTQTVHGANLHLFFMLPSSQTLCEADGKVMQSRLFTNRLLSLGMNLKVSAQTSSIMAHYLAERKREILDELILNFQSLVRERQVTEQYF